jgi:hypothetical protein
MKLILAASFLAMSAVPSMAQTAQVFVKDDPNQCWLDVKDVVHTRGREVTEDEKTWTILSGRYATAAGDMALQTHVSPDKNKKGEEGCTIYVSVSGGAGLAERGRTVNSLSSNNIRVANQIAVEVEALKKIREKKAKQQNP